MLSPLERVDRSSLHPQRRLPLHHLHRLAQPLPQHRRPQDVVPIDHRLQRAHEPLQRLPARKAQQVRQKVRIALASHQVMEQDPFLQRRQRIDVLHVPHSARHARHDPVDLLLAQLHQRQHLRRDRLASRPGSGSAALRTCSLSPLTAARQLRQRRRREQRTHIRRAAPPVASAPSASPPAASARRARRSCRAGRPARPSAPPPRAAPASPPISPRGAS